MNEQRREEEEKKTEEKPKREHPTAKVANGHAHGQWMNEDVLKQICDALRTFGDRSKTDAARKGCRMSWECFTLTDFWLSIFCSLSRSLAHHVSHSSTALFVCVCLWVRAHVNLSTGNGFVVALGNSESFGWDWKDQFNRMGVTQTQKTVTAYTTHTT